MSYKIRREKKYWDKVSMHPNFYPHLNGIVELENRTCFLTDNIPCISLKKLISGNGSLQESDICMIGAQIVLAVTHLHDNGIVHRCLSPDIIALDWSGRVRITDLSTCKQRGCTFELETIQRVKYPFIAPEILKGQCYEPCSDWWLVGCCLWSLFTGKSLLSQHNSLQSLFKNISKECCKEAIEDIIRSPIEYPQQLSKNAISILSGFLEKDSNKRLKWNQETGIKSIKEHPFFSTIDWNKLASNENVGTIQMDLSYSIWSSEQTIVKQLLGSDYGGKYGSCHLISHNKTNEEGVVKIVWKAKMRKTESGWKQVMNERLVWQKVSAHPYIISLKGFFETEAAYCFVTQYISDAVSLSVVIKSAPLPEDVVKFLSGQLVIAVNHLHQKGILHRELSPDCILIEKCGRLRLCDFESSKVTQFSFRPFGDCTYMAPEIIQGKDYGKEADWWSFGIIMFEMILGNTPLDIYCDKRQISEDSDINTEILLRVVESIPKLLANINSIPAQNLLKFFLTAIPEHRLGFKRNAFNEIKCHQFYRSLMWQKLQSPDS